MTAPEKPSPNRSGDGFFCKYSVDGPDLALEQEADQVNQPHKGSAEDENDADDDAEHIVRNDAAEQTIDRPYDVEHRDAKNQLCNLRQFIDQFDDLLYGIHDNISFPIE